MTRETTQVKNRSARENGDLLHRAREFRQSSAGGKQNQNSADASSHQRPLAEVVQLLDANLELGLTSSEAKERLKKYGPNRLSARQSRSAFVRFLFQFREPLVYILLIASAITLLLGEWIDASVIFGVVFINAIIGFLQESKAENALEALRGIVTTEATVRRDGQKSRISAEALVPGDVVLLQSGDRVPADVRLFRVRNLQVDESALTGESVPVLKHTEPLALDTVLAERKNLAYTGSLVTQGQAEGVVWVTGDKTETGRIAWLISEAVDLTTPLTRKISEFSRILLYIVMALALLTFGVGLWRGQSAVEMFMAALALSVSAIPEGLPAAVTITLAIGVNRMAKRQAIIRKLPAVEALGSTTVICSDKTGTLTENQMTVQEIWTPGRSYSLSGTGYQPEGSISVEGRVMSPEKGVHIALLECLKAGLLCNDTVLVQNGERTKVEGDPTEAALIVAAQKAGFSRSDTHGENPRLDSIPFESDYQYMATLHKSDAGHMVYKKGAMERLIEKCPVMLLDDGREIPIDKAAVQEAAARMASRGLRVLAFARLKAPAHQSKLDHHHVAEGLTFLGLQGMMDPPRKEATDAVARCQEAGISVKMITGDHLLTAKAIAGQIGLRNKAGGDLHAITGRDLERMADEDLPDVAERTNVFARVAPEQKLRLVRALQKQGHIVAMTGDGVNDAPALKQADIGVAMGQAGTDVAKEAADMILLDDNFATIEAAVEEGRAIFDNLSKFIIWTLPTNIGESLIILTAVFFGLAIPLVPVQLLWINMTTAIFLGLMLVFEPKEEGIMARPPRDPKTPILTFPLFMRTGLVSLIMLAGAFGLFYWEHALNGRELAEARTAAVNVVVIVECFYLLNSRCLKRIMFGVGIFSNMWIWYGIAAMIGVQLLLTYVPFMNMLFHTAPIRAEAWLYIVGIGLAAYFIVEFEKWVRFRGGYREE